MSTPIGKSQEIPSIATQPIPVTSPLGKPVRRDSASDPRVTENAHSVDAVSDTPPMRPRDSLERRSSEGQATRSRSVTPEPRQGREEKAFNGPELTPPSRSFVYDLDEYEPPVMQPEAPVDTKQAERVSKLRDVLNKGVDTMVSELEKGTKADPAAIDSAMKYLSTALNGLLKAGVTHATAVQMFKEATEDALVGLKDTSKIKGTSRMKLAIEGAKFLDRYADDSNRDIACRHLAQTVKDIDPKQLHRETLDRARLAKKMERDNAPKPTTLGGKLKKAGESLKEGGLTGWRGLKATTRKVKAEHGAAEKAEAARVAEHDHYRGLVSTALEALIDFTQPGVMKSDIELERLCGKLHSARDTHNANEFDDARWQAGVEDFVVEQHTDSLVRLATRLLETIPSRPFSTEHLNFLGRVLQAELMLRSGCKDIAQALGKRELSGSCSKQEAVSWDIGHVTELMVTLLTVEGPDEAIVLKDLEPTIQWKNYSSREGAAEEAVKALTQQQLDGVEAKLQKAQNRSLSDLLKAVTARQVALKTSTAPLLLTLPPDLG